MRLNKFLARTGIGSRRICDQYIKDRKIKINGKIITDFSYLVKDDDYIQFKNKTINYVEEDIYYILNKPINYICSSKDEKLYLKSWNEARSLTRSRQFSQQTAN